MNERLPVVRPAQPVFGGEDRPRIADRHRHLPLDAQSENQPQL